MSLSTWDKFQIVQKIYIHEGVGEIFSPEYATRDYGVNFFKLEYQKHYAPSLSVSIGADGARPDIQINFTNEGLKKLLKTNKAMIDEVNRLFDELVSDGEL